jgi:hypothetical protein
MEDFNALAAALGADLDGVRASLILSRDGLVIGAHPADGEDVAKRAWLKLASLGDPDRGFFQFATETWSYVRRGPYAAFVVAAATVRPGLLIDQMERVLLAAEENRADRSSLKPDASAPVAAAAPSGKPRTTLHREAAKADDEPIVIHEEAPVAAAPAEAEPAIEAGPEPTPPANPPSKSGRPSIWATDANDDEGDNESFTSLASEFGRLLQEGEQGADG